MTKVKFRTNTGTAQYPWLQPGRPDTAFDPEGKYKVQLKMSEEDAQPLLETLKAVKAENFSPKDKVRLPFSRDEETGEVVFKMQSKFIPKYVDASGKLIPENSVPMMYSGSTMRIAGILDPYVNGGSKGISMRLGAVQVINPVSSGSEGGFESEFDAVDGFTTSDSAPTVSNDLDDDFDF